MENAVPDVEFEDLLQMLKDTRGFDFSGYKRPTLIRRFRKRMDACALETFGEYSDYLELEPDEFAKLFDSLLINVTAFFRDPAAWDTLSEEVIPELLAAKGATRPIRVWSAGCATGEEAYTLAMVLTEALGEDSFRNRVKIYATDLDEDALRQARTGTYTERQLASVPTDLREKYFEPAPSGHIFRRDLRRQVIFGRNNLTHDAPISRVDLLVARNTLMYFNAETQATVVHRFHFALNDPGYLFLGKAEMILNHGDLFDPVDLRKRLFRKSPSPTAAAEARTGREGRTHDRLSAVLEAATLSAGPVAQLAIDLEGKLAVANSRAESLFNLHPRDIGRPFQDLEVSYRPAELRSIIDRAQAEHRQIDLRDILWQRTASPEPDVYDVSVVPLHAASGDLVGIGISFTDVSHYRRLRDQLEHSNQELGRAYEELQSLNEELETTNEELQSTNEELETTNEELQSTNEELETMNQELQSTNDELQEINDALRTRSGELDATHAFLDSILRSLGGAVIVVDRDLKVKVWSPGATELWGMRPEEAEGIPLLALDIGLPVIEIGPPLLQLMKTGSDSFNSTVHAVNRRGRPLQLGIDYRLLQGENHDPTGVIMVMNPLEEPDHH